MYSITTTNLHIYLKWITKFDQKKTKQRREAKGRIVVIEVPTHPPLPPLNPPKLVIKSEETNLQESTFFSLSGFASKQV